MSSSLLDREFIFVAGKGGVGRTTVSATLAKLAASEGKRVLVAMCNTKERLSHLMGCPPIGDQVMNIAEGIDAVNMTPEASLQEYGRMILKVGALYRAVFGNRYVMSFLRGTPGIESWSLLGKAYYHVNEEQNGRPRYDLVILDGPATGHALDMLRTPHALREMVPPGLMRREADGAWELFTDPERTAFALVSIPEDMPVNETVELYQTFNDELGLPVGGVILNRCYPDLFDAAEEAWLEQVEPASGSISSSLLESGRRRVAREVMQVEAERRLAEDIGVPLFRLPEIHSAAFGVGEIEALSEALGAQGMRASERVL